MKRFMVGLGFGSLLLLLSAQIQAEMPVSVSSDGRTIQSGVTWHTDLDSGWRESKRRGVPMLIFITTDNCTYCSAMKKNTWCDATIQQRLANSFVGVRLTPARNAATLNRIKVPSYPTTLAGSPNGKIIGHRIGYQPPGELHQFLSEVVAKAGKRLLARDIH